jgi:hypothetical protein
MGLTVTFGCGHTAEIGETSDAPMCPVCADTRVSRTNAPAPRFSGFCSSPLKKD